MSLRSTVFTPDARGDAVRLPVRRVSGTFQGIRQPQPRGWRKYPGPQQRRQRRVDQDNNKRRICVQEGLRHLSALVVSRAVEQILRSFSTPYMLRSRQCLIKYLKANCPRISRPYQMVISDAEPDPASSDLVRISIQFYPDHFSRSRRSCLEVSGALSFSAITSSAFESRRLRRQNLAS